MVGSLCTHVLNRPDLAQDHRFRRNSSRLDNDAALRAIIEQTMSELTAEQVVTRLDAHGIANARMRTIDEFAQHPQLAARDRWREVDSPVGPARSLLPPVTMVDREAAMGAIPALGQHTNAIRAEFAPMEAQPIMDQS